jgi:hypothetical protein
MYISSVMVPSWMRAGTHYSQSVCMYVCMYVCNSCFGRALTYQVVYMWLKSIHKYYLERVHRAKRVK